MMGRKGKPVIWADVKVMLNGQEIKGVKDIILKDKTFFAGTITDTVFTSSGEPTGNLRIMDLNEAIPLASAEDLKKYFIDPIETE